ncbi:MAG: GLPGLI family protein [Bacteroidetes bacterium]|nr:GLPGLI family protein [Bacteroidota bacterium]MDA0860739.1 GLPGLI family protein [Bacteroidota bacterium]MDA1318852.1 GLPGLI family protein [Bacteroidota bacterium]
MKTQYFKIIFISIALLFSNAVIYAQDFQGKATYISKSKMELGRWGARMSEAQKKQIAARLKNRLEKEFVLVFNKQESVFTEEEQLDAISGATDSWGKNFAAGENYKNVKTNAQIQQQEFYGKKFLVKDKLQKIDWTLGKESKQIGNYLCYKATSFIPTDDLLWYSFSWSRMRSTDNQDAEDEENNEPEVDVTQIEAWYTPQIPVGHGPSEYWGLPGLILEVSAGGTTMLCSKIVINSVETIEIEAPKKGTTVTKNEYQDIIQKKMAEFRNNRMRRR